MAVLGSDEGARILDTVEHDGGPLRRFAEATGTRLLEVVIVRHLGVASLGFSVGGSSGDRGRTPPAAILGTLFCRELRFDGEGSGGSK